MKKTQKKITAKKTAAKRVLTEEQRLKRNAYMREYLREYNKDPEHRKAKSAYQREYYRRIKEEKARAERNKTKHEMAKRFSDGLKKVNAVKKAGKAVHASKVATKANPRKQAAKPVAAKKTVKVGKKGGK